MVDFTNDEIVATRRMKMKEPLVSGALSQSAFRPRIQRSTPSINSSLGWVLSRSPSCFVVLIVFYERTEYLLHVAEPLKPQSALTDNQWGANSLPALSNEKPAAPTQRGARCWLRLTAEVAALCFRSRFFETFGGARHRGCVVVACRPSRTMNDYFRPC